MRLKVGIVVVLIALAAISCGCMNRQNVQKVQPKTSTSNTSNVLKVGVIGPMELPFGKAEKKAVMLAAQQINDNGGILGKKVVVEVGDTKLNQNTATSEFRRLVDDGCKVIIGGFASGISMSMQQVMAKTKTVWLADGASTELTKRVKDDYRDYKYFFRAGTLNSSTFAYDIFDALNNYFNGKLHKNWRRVAVIRDNALWTDDVMRVLRPMLEKNNYTVVMDDKVPMGTSDFSTILYEVKQKRADVIITLLAHVDGIPLVKQWSNMHVPAQIIGHDLSALSPYAWNNSNGKVNGEVFIATGGAVPVPVNARAKAFLKAWKEKYGDLPEANTAYDMYDALFMYRQAVEQAKDHGAKDPFSSDVVVHYLEMINRTHPFECVRGRFAFTKYHDPVWGNSYIRNWICQWQNGKIVIIWPKNVATGSYVQPSWVR